MHKLSIMQRLLRERAMERYIAALEKGDLETLASIMRRAEKDAALEQLIFEMHATYQTEEEFLAIWQEENVMEIEGGIHKSRPTELEPAEEPQPAHQPGKRARWLQVLAAVLIVCMLAGGFIGIQIWRAPHPAPFASLPNYGWCVMPGPSGINLNLATPQLNGITAITADDAWIAGTYDDESLVEHWNGARWSIVSTPDLSSNGNYGLFGIAAVSASDVWAVGAISPGYQHFFSGVGMHTLIEHWDGHTWSVVPSPDAQAGANNLYSISALAANDIWAVGNTSANGSSPEDARLLVEHWNGTSWGIVQIPTNLGMSQPSTIAAASTNDIWILGQVASSSQPALLHWDGHQWSFTPTPHTRAGDALEAITVGSAHDIWADGTESNGRTFHPLIEHWDGTHWSRFPVPQGQGALGGMLVLSPNNIWVAERGTVNGRYFEQMQHWDGKSWHAISQQDASEGQLMLMVGAGNRLWAIGDTAIDQANTDARGPLIETKC